MTTPIRLAAAMVIFIVGSLVVAAQDTQIRNFRPVTDETLRNPSPDDWINWRRTLDGWGYSPLNQITTFAVGPRPRSTGFLPDSSRAYVGSENGSSVSVIDAMRHRVISTIKLSGDMVRPMGIVSSPDGKYVFVSSGRGKTVVVIDTTTNAPIGFCGGWRATMGSRSVAGRSDGVHRQRSVAGCVVCGRRHAHGVRQGEGGGPALGRRLRVYAIPVSRDPPLRRAPS